MTDAVASAPDPGRAGAPFAIRDATPADAPAIAQLHIDAWRAAYRGVVPDDILDGLSLSERTQRWSARLAEARATTAVCERAGRFVGFITFGPSRDADGAGLAEVIALYVDAGAWRTGVGRVLCDHALARLSVARFAAVTLWVLDENPRARRFYESLGFTADGATKSEMHGRPLLHLRYRRSLAVRAG